jgi:4-amino-4-deoxy-L-arabinose transferase-like glycosyltransferase
VEPHRRRWLLGLAVGALLAQMAVAMIVTAQAQTPTIDEPVYAGAAVVQLQQRTLRFNPEHPPLGKLIMGVGLAFARPQLDPGFTDPGFARSQSALGRHLLYESGNDPYRVMRAARLPMIALTLLFGLVVFGFARDLAGSAGGLVALALYAFSPNVIAHGSLATLDVPVAGFLLTALWLVWRARRRPLPYLPLAGVALGAALATKMNALAAAPVLLVLAAVSVWHATSGSQARRFALGAAWAAGVAVIAVAVVWATYLAVDPHLRWQTPAGVPAFGGWRGLATGWLPLPEPYRDGMRIQFGFEDAAFGGFLFGEAYQGSRWYYLPAALLVKTPLGSLALWLAGAVTLAVVPRLRPAVPYLLLPAAVLLVAAMASTRDLGIRYVIVLPMLLAVVAATVVTLRWRWAPLAAAGLVLLVAVSSARAFPYYLPYANEAFGGPAQTHRHLHDSNVDWGQDLGRLADRLERRYPDERVWLVYKGSGVPSYYGIEASDPLAVPPERVRGLLVVSNSAAARADAELASLIDSSRPIDDIGHSITIYRHPAE